MTTFLPCESLSATLGSLFICSQHGEYQRIRTPYLYPDGDNIDLFCKVQAGTVTVTDLGETTRRLRMQTVSPLIAEAAGHHRGHLPEPRRRVLPRDACACAAGRRLRGSGTRVAQAALRVSDLWFTFRTRSVQSATDEVADVLAENRAPFRACGDATRPVGTDLDR